MSTDLFKRAHKFYLKGNFRKAEDCCQLSISNDVSDFESYNLLGVIAINANKFGVAHAYLQKALEINKDFAEAYGNLGALYEKNGAYEDAKYSLQKAIQIKPDFADAYYNLGLIHQNEKSYELALSLYNNVIQCDPNYVTCYVRIGKVLEYLRDFNRSAEFYKKATELDPTNVEAHVNLGISILYNQGTDAWRDYLGDYIKSSNFSRHDNERVRVIQGRAIASWIMGDNSDCKLYLNEAEKILKEIGVGSKYPNIYAYNYFLTRLLAWYEASNMNDNLYDSDDVDNLYFLGESHSLTCANKVMKIGTNNFICRPSFIMGCKMWHLVNEESNQYKIAFNREIASLKSGSTIILTVGEIDCRCDSGIFKLYINKGISWKDSADDMIFKYFVKVVLPLKGVGMLPVVWGIPAAHSGIVETLYKNHKQEYLNFIKYFNEQLRIYSAKYDVKLIDNYAATIDENGFSQDGTKLDKLHLKPDVFMQAIQDSMVNN